MKKSSFILILFGDYITEQKVKGAAKYERFYSDITFFSGIHYRTDC